MKLLLQCRDLNRVLFYFLFLKECSKGGQNGGSIDHAFRKVRKNSLGFHIWKVEVRTAYAKSQVASSSSFCLVSKQIFISQNNHVEAVPKEKFGIFHDDCTYIIYAATIKGCIVNQYTIVSFVFSFSANLVQVNLFQFSNGRAVKLNQIRHRFMDSFTFGWAKIPHLINRVM